MAWNLGDILDAIGPMLPQEAPALIHGDRTITWGEEIVRQNNLARALITRGAKPGDKVAFYMRNRPEYAELMGACVKARLTHVNVNYRYKPDEVFYIFDNSDAQTVVYGAEFRDIIEEIRPRLEKVETYVEIADAGGAIASFAENYDMLVAEGDGRALGISRSPDDQFFIYTGGTTGMPKGVMWTHHELREALLASVRVLGPVPENVEEVKEEIAEKGPGARVLPCCPQMHGTGMTTSLSALLSGGCVITLQSPSLDPKEVWREVERNRAESLVIVGDPFAKPLLKALDDDPGHYDLSSLVNMISSGVMWSTEVKRGLIRHIPQIKLLDGFGSSESIGLGTSVMSKDGEIQTAQFTIGERCLVFDENDQPISPGSGKPGMIAQRPPIPIGYYKDEEKTAKTFRTINGVRYAIAGDWCTVEADGSLTLLGRGSACINTAGEKVFPEEVEEVLKLHPAVDDTLVVGVPDEKWGQAVTAVIRVVPGQAFDEAAIRSHVRKQLAGYKTPKRILVSDLPLRAPNGKADYKAALEFALAKL